MLMFLVRFSHPERARCARRSHPYCTTQAIRVPPMGGDGYPAAALSDYEPEQFGQRRLRGRHLTKSLASYTVTTVTVLGACCVSRPRLHHVTDSGVKNSSM